MMENTESGSTDNEPAAKIPLKDRIRLIIFEAHTPAGKAFDVGLIIFIALSILVVMLESVASVAERHGTLLRVVEWIVTICFTVEYILRLLCVRRPLRYAVSFFGLVDLMAILPTYLSIIFPATRFLTVIRALRMLRVFRVLKLARYLRAASMITRALSASRVKISVFLYAVLTVVVIIGSTMYIIEGGENDFTSIPRSVYWAIVTLTTVGYGDISPQTPLGQALAAVVMILGYGMIAVPTGIVSVELAHQQEEIITRACPACACEVHAPDARFCRRCGHVLRERKTKLPEAERSPTRFTVLEPEPPPEPEEDEEDDEDEEE